MNSNNDLLVPYGAVEKHIECSICLSVIKGAVLTPCGHRFCNRCITEWVEKNQRCPCCNGQLHADQFYYDVQFDMLVDEVLLERDKAEQTVFDQMFTDGINSSGFERDSTKSQFEEIFKKHMKSSLLSYMQYFGRLRNDYQKKICDLDNELNAQNLTDFQNGADKGLTEMNIESLKQNMLKSLEESEKMAAESYDKYLTENMPNIEVCPVNVSVYVSDKSIRLTGISIKPSDKLAVLKPFLEKAMLARCDQIISWNDEDSLILLFGPLSKQSTYSIVDVVSNIQNLQNVHQLTWDSKPIFEFYMSPGSEIVFSNAFKTESDLSDQCFVNTFDEKQPQSVDYFQCHNCNIKWICKSCIQNCHKGHDIAPFALQHSPTWACCYCSKKKICKFVN